LLANTVFAATRNSAITANFAKLLVISCIYGFNREIGAKYLNSSQKSSAHKGILAQAVRDVQPLAP
jgi:hypothetical protein